MLKSFRNKLKRRTQDPSPTVEPLRSCPCVTGSDTDSLNHLPLYEYKPLPTPRSTRLFWLEPGPPKSLIRGSLKSAGIDSDIAYYCLSYTWGNTDTPHVIECDGCQVKVTCNLYSALDRLRGLVERSLWFVDALSINQSTDIEALRERASQVRLMQSIFANAQMVYAAIGEEIDSRTLEIMLRLRTIDSDEWAYMAQKPERFKQLGLPSWDDGAWGHLASIFERPWFERIWIVQEYALAKDILFLAGNELLQGSLLWFSLVRATQTLHRSDTIEPDSSEEANFQYTRLAWRLNHAQHRLRALSNFHGTLVSPQTSISRSLVQTLISTSEYKATDLRDRVYAIFGIIQDADMSNFRVDYSEDARDLSVRLSSFIVQHEDPQALVYFLHELACHDVSTGSGSWMIDLGSRKKRTGIDTNLRGLNDQDLYRNKNRRLVDCRIGQKTRTLVVKGLVFDQVVHISRPYPPVTVPKSDDATSDYLAQTFVWDLETMTAVLEKVGATSDDVLFWINRYRRTTIANVKEFEGSPAPTDSEIQQYCMFQLNHETRDRSSGAILLTQKISRLMNAFCENSCVAITRDRKLCLVPSTVQSGDGLAIFNGFLTPSLLRPVEDGYHILGGTYVHEMMDGQVYELPNVREVDIVLY